MLRITLTATVCFVIISYSTAVNAGSMIIDHHNTDISQIPVTAIEQAKATLHIAYGHTSHGSQLISGMGSGGTQLDSFLNNSPRYNSSISGIYSGLYTWNNGGANGALDLHDHAMGGDVGYYPAWLNNTRAYLDDPANSDVNVIIWSWCGQASGYSEQDMLNKYLIPMNQLEQDYPDVTFVYMTGHLNGSGETGNLHLRNEQIRQYCLLNNKVLYDFADIESYDPDGLVNYMTLIANDNCDYDGDDNGSRESNWALSWQNNHSIDVDWWASGAAHSRHLNGNLKGFAAWWLWARIAGWDGGAHLSSDIDKDGDIDGGDLAALIVSGIPVPINEFAVYFGRCYSY